MKRVYVQHGGYGCDTGCCGHWVSLEGVEKPRHRFHWGHPDSKDDPKEWVKQVLTEELGTEHVADIDWDETVIYDWDDELVLGQW